MLTSPYSGVNELFRHEREDFCQAGEDGGCECPPPRISIGGTASSADSSLKCGKPDNRDIEDVTIRFVQDRRSVA
jgi:hypothetical protein